MRKPGDPTFRMRIDLEITDKALGGLMPADRVRIQQKVMARMMAEGKRALQEELGITEPRGKVIEGCVVQRPYPFVIDNRESPNQKVLEHDVTSP